MATSSFANPEIPVLTSSATTGNQWYRNNEVISGATSASYSVNAPGTYIVKVAADDCAVATSDAAVIVITGIESEAGIQVKAYPNRRPVSNLQQQHQIYQEQPSKSSTRTVSRSRYYGPKPLMAADACSPSAETMYLR